MAQQTPKEEAEELVLKMYQFLPASKESEKGKEHLYYNQYNAAKQCAKLAVDNILNNNCGSYTDESSATNNEIYCDEYYWEQVKTELEKL